MECVQECADESMQKVVEEVKQREDYATNGEVVCVCVCVCDEYLHCSG